MANRPGEKEAKFRERQILTATELNRAVDATLKRIVSGKGLGHKTMHNQLVFFIKDKVGRSNSASEEEIVEPEICDCQNALSFEECWSFAWIQNLNIEGAIGGGFDVLMKWELTDGGGTPLTNCADIIARANCEDPCDFGWILTQDGEAPQPMQKFPFDGTGNDTVNIVTPWGDIVSYGFGFDIGQFTIINIDCGDIGVNIFEISPAINNECPDFTGEEAPCLASDDPRQVCIDGCI